jgi:hypothetical protein
MRRLNLNPNYSKQVQRSGRSHLTVIKTHILNHLLSSVEWDNKIQAEGASIKFLAGWEGRDCRWPIADCRFALPRITARLGTFGIGNWKLEIGK